MSIGAFSIDQLMELAGLSVSQAGLSTTFIYLFSKEITVVLMTMSLVYRVHPLSMGRRILVACGPGNNGECSSSDLQ